MVMTNKNSLSLLLLLLVLVVAAGALWLVYSDGQQSEGEPTPLPRVTFVIGSVSNDIEDDLEEYGPVADYIAINMAEFGYVGGEVVVAPSVAEMAKLMRRGEVDVFIDSPFPTFAVDQLAQSAPLVNRWKKGVEKYQTAIFTRRDSGVESLDDLRGKVMVMDHPESTSGYFLPKTELLKRGYTLRQVAGPVSPVSADEIGYYFTNDDSDLVDAVVNGVVAAGAQNDNELFDQLEELGEEPGAYPVLLTSNSVYRHVVTASSYMDPAVREALVTLLVGMDKDEVGQAILKDFKKTKRFTPFEPTPQAAYEGINELVGLVEDEIINR